MTGSARPSTETVPIQRELFDSGKSRLARYRDLVVGGSVLDLVRYEVVVTVASALPGALGLVLRSRLYPLLLGRAGRNVTFGTNVVLRHPRKIHIGDHVAVDDNVVLDAKGADNRGIVIGDHVFIGRNTILSCKNGDIHVGDGSNIGFNCEIFSASEVRLGRNVLMAAYGYLVGGTHAFDRVDVPVSLQDRRSRGIEVGENAWIGAHAVVVDGTRIGRDAVIGAGAVVTRDVPDWHVAAGVPARPLRDRRLTAPPAAAP